jgi:hypothetical protein
VVALVALVSAVVPVAALLGAVAEVSVPAAPAVLAPGDVAPAPVAVLLLGLVAELAPVDGLALVELGELVVWATATAPSARAPRTPAMVAIFIRSYSMLR